MAGYTDYPTLLQESRPHIVSICTGPHMHYEIIEQCVQNGVKAIYCEKPLDISLEEAQKSVELCEENGVVLVVNHMRRFSEFHQKISEGLEDETLGRMVVASSGYSGGIYNSGTHVVDLIRLYFGEVKWVSAHFSPHINGNREDPNIDAVLGMRNNCQVVVQAHGIPGVFDVDIVTTKYKLHINAAALFNDQPFLTVDKREENNYFTGSYKFVRNFDILEEFITLTTNTNNDYMVNGVEYLAECIDNKDLTPPPSGKDGFEALRVVEKIHESARNRGSRIYIG